jgi:hypothetical protein
LADDILDSISPIRVGTRIGNKISNDFQRTVFDLFEERCVVGKLGRVELTGALDGVLVQIQSTAVVGLMVLKNDR